jgi:hypothetical protein
MMRRKNFAFWDAAKALRSAIIENVAAVVAQVGFSPRFTPGPAKTPQRRPEVERIPRPRSLNLKKKRLQLQQSLDLPSS